MDDYGPEYTDEDWRPEDDDDDDWVLDPMTGDQIKPRARIRIALALMVLYQI